MIGFILSFILVFGVTIVDANARTPFSLFGHVGHSRNGLGGTGPTGTAFACDTVGTGVCAEHKSGQTFVTWPDSTVDATKRTRVVRSASPITAGNYGAATVVAAYIPPNSGQLFGGDPASSGTNPFTMAYRQTSTRPMVPMTIAGHTLVYGDGLQAYTAVGSGAAYYAVVRTDTLNGSPVYLGSVGPIAESVATPSAIQVAASTRSTTGQITTTANKPIVFLAHASTNGGGCGLTDCTHGDYWSIFLPPDSGWTDGRQTVFNVQQDTVGAYPSLGSGSIVVRGRDTIYNSPGTDQIETFWTGIGMSPQGGTANRFYKTTLNTVQHELNWAVDHYNLDENQIHWIGTSLGADGGAWTGVHMTNPQLAAAWLTYPTWRYYNFSSYYWPGASWDPGDPYAATIGTCPSCLGGDFSTVLMDDGTAFGGTGGYYDIPGFIAANPGADLPFVAWMISYDDQNLTVAGPHSFQEEIDAANAFESSHHGYCMVFGVGRHDVNGIGACDLDDSHKITGVAYSKSLFKLNVPYMAFSNSSINDNFGTNTRDAFGMYVGDSVGCHNCGFNWTVPTDTSTNFAGTVGNTWMIRNPTYVTTPARATLVTPGSLSATSGTTTPFTVDSAPFVALFGPQNQYFNIGGTEIIRGTPNGSTVTLAFRGTVNTSGHVHSAGEIVQQYISVPSGPNGGPYTTMTADVTPRRLQNFRPANGAVLTCTVTPFGAGSTSRTPTVANGIFTLTNVTINSGGSTSVACH